MVLPDFEGWAVFATVAEQRSFSAAATTLGVSKATVSKTVTRLETRLGVTLFHRTSRRLALTDSGAALVERAQTMLADAVETEECAREDVGVPRGTVRLAVPMSLGITEVGPFIATFLAAYPDISVEMHLSDGLVDLVGEGYDVALRIGTLPDSSLRARKLRDVRRLIVASPGWVSRHPEVRTPDDLQAADVFGYTNLPRHRQIILTRADGTEAALPAEGRLRANNADAMLAAVEAGLGVAMAPDFIVAGALAAGRLVTILDDWLPTPVALHLLTPPGLLRPRRVEALIGFLAEALGAK
jgi:DNA-binding transcriptional LysR family regulator